MKYKLISNNDEIDIIKKILKNRNIENLEEIKKPSEKNIIDKYKLKNLEQAVEFIVEAVAKKFKIGLIWDCDCDGYASGALIHNYLHKRFKDINLIDYFHTGKEHGISNDIKLDEDLDVLIVVDGGSNDYKQHESLKKKGTTVLVLDHHICDKESEFAIVVNNQISPEYNNKQLSGVGICFKFCEAIDDYFGLNDNLAQYYIDLVAMGNIGDMMDLQSMETRHYAYKGLHNINNKLIRAIINKQSFSIGGKINYHTMAFYVVPLINALIREGKQEEKILMAEAFMDSDRTVPYKKRGSNDVIQVHIADECARLMGNAKSRQDNKVKKAYTQIEQIIEENKLYENKVIIIDVTELIDKNFTGLVANKLLGKYKRPIIILKKDNREANRFGGSGRGYGVENFKQVCLESGLFTLAEGHNNAFGVGCDMDRIVDITNYFNEVFKNSIFETEYEVDLELEVDKLKVSDILAVAELEDIWGSTLKEPLFLIKNIKIKDNEVVLGGTKIKIAHFKHKNINFKKMYCNDETFDRLRNKTRNQFGSKNIKIDIIGKFKVDKVGDKTFAGIEIIDFESNDYLDLIF